jgi:hypothetical protein
MNYTTKAIILFLILAGVLIIFTKTGTNLAYLYIVPILLITIVINWFLHKEIKRDHEENLQQGMRYTMEENEAQHWLHDMFLPKMRRLLRREMRAIIIASGVILLLFVFVWSYFVNGLNNALINSFVAAILFVAFLCYALLSPKIFNKIFKHTPRSIRKHRNNDWVHGYLLLLPITTLSFVLLSITNTPSNFLTNLLAVPLFIFFYTLFFICLYCIWFIYAEYQKEEEKTLKKSVEEMLKK